MTEKEEQRAKREARDEVLNWAVAVFFYGICTVILVGGVVTMVKDWLL